MNSIIERVKLIKKQYRLINLEEVKLEGELPLLILKDEKTNNYLISHNKRILIYSDKFELVKEQIFKNIEFENSPFIVLRDEYLICVPSYGNNCLKKICRKTGVILKEFKLDVIIGRMLNLSKDKIIASCYDDQGEIFLLILDNDFKILDKIVFDNKLNLISGKGNVIPIEVKDSETIFVLENRDVLSQNVILFSLKTKEWTDWSFLPLLFNDKAWTMKKYKELLIISGENFLACFDKNKIVFKKRFEKYGAYIHLAGICFLNNKEYLFFYDTGSNKVYKAEL